MKPSYKKLQGMYEHEKAMNELNGECIMLMREHLESVGITASFADDAADMAAQEIHILREKLKRLQLKLKQLRAKGKR